MTQDTNQRTPYQAKHDAEFEGSKMGHPYVWYIGLTCVLFLFLLGAGYLALSNGWIPQR